MVELQKNLKEIQSAAGQIVAISYDSVEVINRFSAKESIEFSLLSDARSKTIDAFGIRNHQAPERVQGIPHPVTFVIDKTGVIRAKLFRDGYAKRHPPTELIETLRKLR